MAALEIKNLHVRIAEEDDEQVLQDVDLEVESSETHALMSPSGSDKSTTSKIIAGHPTYEVTDGKVLLHLEDDDFGDFEIPDDARTWNLLELEPNKRAALGIFLGFQYPAEIEGVVVTNFLHATLNVKIGKRKELLFDEDVEEEEEEADYSTSPMEGNVDDGGVSVAESQKLLRGKTDLLDMGEKLIQRYPNVGFSGGKEKQNEVLQTTILEPLIAMLGKIDLSLDADRLRDASKGIDALRDEQGTGILQITHYQCILEYVEPDHVHIMLDGKVVKGGDVSLVFGLEDKGHDWVREEVYGAA